MLYTSKRWTGVDNVEYMWNTALLPVLTYDIHCIRMSQKSLGDLEIPYEVTSIFSWFPYICNRNVLLFVASHNQHIVQMVYLSMTVLIDKL